MNHLISNKSIFKNLIHENHFVLNWTKNDFIMSRKSSTWLEKFTQLTNFDIKRMMIVEILKRAKFESWLATFDFNDNFKQSRRSLKLAATMSHNDKIYVLMYKDKYRLQKKHVESVWMIHDKQYKIIYISNKQKDLMIDSSFTIIE